MTYTYAEVIEAKTIMCQGPPDYSIPKQIVKFFVCRLIFNFLRCWPFIK